jgi:uncharacterized SAM-binding protein YcdF (DUF218 family)
VKRFGLSLALASLACCARGAGHAEIAPTPGPLDAIVVLGHRPSTSAQGLAYEARTRVEQGVALYREGRAPRVLLAGGPTDEGVIEADVMAAHAEAAGVPRTAILRERISEDTIANARLSVALLQQTLGLARPPRVLLVTSDYHMPRAARLFRCAGAHVVEATVALALSPDECARRRRSERIVALYYWFIPECKRAGS